MRVGYVAACACATILLIAAVTKFASRKGPDELLRSIGFPEAVSRPVAMITPVWELALAVLILATIGLPVLLILTATTLLMMGVVLVAVQRGSGAACHCFAGLEQESMIGWLAALRSAALVGLSIVALAGYIVVGADAGGFQLSEWFAGSVIAAAYVVVFSLFSKMTLLSRSVLRISVERIAR